MASSIFYSLRLGFSASPSHCTNNKNIPWFHQQSYSTRTVTTAIATDAPVVRRSANYPPSEWSYDFLQSLAGNHVVEKYKTTSTCLKEQVRTMISIETTVEKPLSTLELVDDLQRLGISYHFKNEISNILKKIYNCYFEAYKNWNNLDLNLKALGFRLLRQHGYHIPQEIFEDIMDEKGHLKANVGEDIVGTLNLYEASFYAVHGDNILDVAREFITKCLKERLEKKNIVNKSTFMLISHALELPLYWRIPRFESIWFIEAYKGRRDMNSLLLDFAELDYNVVQGIHQEDLKFSSWWWVGLQWDKKLVFARDRMVESFMWSVGANHEPEYSALRRNVTKNITMVNVIDDVYDVYGTLEELEQFTQVVRRWDVNAIEELPDYMKICFLGFYNTVNEMGYNTLINKNSFVIPYVKKAWTEYCEANLIEARWFHSGYTPTLEEYLNNSCITVAVPIIVSGAYFLDSNDFIGEALQNVIRWSAMVLRLADDLGTSSAELERGDVPKAVQCYMHETGVSEEEARAYIKKLILIAYKNITKERMNCKSTDLQIFMECASNLGRMGQFTYERGDIFGAPDDLYKSHQMSLLFEPKS
ncbi:R-linalool synthase QH1, chloroplastic-like [Rutidosis leptorrhynchoides]|uniref:R-linalool synthase QH1, chloroplastic-like n=1 Tax=Rutidosis leptorrhynchoides TaxID=125765 RepID=UPI003A993F89